MRFYPNRIALPAVVGLALLTVPSAEGGQVSWVPDADGDWGVASNWSSDPALPAADDDVTVNTGSSRTITIQNTSPSVASLHCTDDLVIRGRYLEVGAGGGEIGGALTIENVGDQWAYLEANTGRLVAGGPTTIRGGDLYAWDGGKLELPNFTTFRPSGNRRGEQFAASGIGGLLDMHALQTIQDPGKPWDLEIYAQEGARTVMGNLRVDNPVSRGNLSFMAYDPGSVLDVSAMPGFPDTGPDTWGGMVAGIGATLVVSDTLTSLENRYITLGVNSSVQRTDGTDALPRFTSITNGVINADGGTPDFSGLTNVSGSSLWTGFGGRLTLPPAVSTYTLGGAYEDWPGFESFDASSVTDLSSIRTLQADSSWNLHLQAVDGGQVNLQNLGGIPAEGFLWVDCHGAGGSLVDLSSMTDVQSGMWLIAEDGGEIRLSPSATIHLEEAYVDVLNGGIITGGTLLLAGPAGLGSLEGNGIIHANVVNASGTVAPGSSPGVLTIGQDYTQGAAGTLQIEITGASPDLYDALRVNGNALLDGVLDLVVQEGAAFEIEPGMEFRVLQAGRRSGTFTGLPDGALVWSEVGGDGDQLFIDYRPGGVVLTSVPEPGAWTLVLSGACLAGLIALRRGRRAAAGFL